MERLIRHKFLHKIAIGGKFFLRWVSKDKFEFFRTGVQIAENVVFYDFALQFSLCEVKSNSVDCLWVAIDKYGFRSPAAQRLNPKSTAARKQIQNPRTNDYISQGRKNRTTHH